MTKLDNISLRLAPLSNRMVMARFGKDKEVALDTKDVTSDVLQLITQYMFGSMPDVGQAMELQFGGGSEQFVMKITRIPGKDAKS